MAVCSGRSVDQSGSAFGEQDESKSKSKSKNKGEGNGKNKGLVDADMAAVDRRGWIAWVIFG
jgi:hypothetical protein